MTWSSRKKKGYFLYCLSCPKFFKYFFFVLSQWIVYWIHFQNIHTFSYQKHYFIHFFCLFLKPLKAFSVFWRATNLLAGTHWQISGKNVCLHFLYWPIALINLLKLVLVLASWKKLMSLQILKMISFFPTNLVYLHRSPKFLKIWFLNNYQIT